jgi:hypothetical protein
LLDPPGHITGDTIRYAVQKTGAKLQVVLRNGTKRTLPDAALAEGEAPIAVRGARVAYFRAKDRALVAYRPGGGPPARMGSLFAPRTGHTAGFSGDGGEALLIKKGATAEVTVTDLHGGILRHDTPPEVVAANLPDGSRHARASCRPPPTGRASGR